MLRAWSIPFAVMAIALLALDALLNLAGAGTTEFFVAITVFAIAGGCYVGYRVVAEGDGQFDGSERRRPYKVFW